MKNSENWKEDTENKEADPTGKFWGKKVGFDLVWVPSPLSFQEHEQCGAFVP